MTIPVGGYSFQDVRTSYSFGSQRRLAGRLSAQHGSFFSGEKTSVSFGLGAGGFGGGRLELTRQLSVEPGVSFNWVDLPEGSFSTRLVTARSDVLTVSRKHLESGVAAVRDVHETIRADSNPAGIEELPGAVPTATPLRFENESPGFVG